MQLLYIFTAHNKHCALLLRQAFKLYPHPMPTLSAYRLVLCDTHDTSILTVDTYVTIPVSPRSRYTAVYRRTNNYGETTQLHASIVSIADAVQLFPI